jgi:hypothetical protein
MQEEEARQAASAATAATPTTSATAITSAMNVDESTIPVPAVVQESQLAPVDTVNSKNKRLNT